MIGGSGSENLLNMLDPKTGRDIELETLEMRQEYLSPIGDLLVKRNVLEAIISRLYQTHESFKRNASMNKLKGSSVLCSTQLLSRLMECDANRFHKVIHELLGEDKQ